MSEKNPKRKDDKAEKDVPNPDDETAAPKSYPAESVPDKPAQLSKRKRSNEVERAMRDLEDLLAEHSRANKWRAFEDSIRAFVSHATVPTFGTAWDKQQELEEDIHSLKRRIADQTGELIQLKEGSKEKESQIATLKSDVESLRAKESLRHLLDRVGDSARTALLEGATLKGLFDEHESCNAFVVSIDLRRSTELMLKAREPRLFAEFITSLAEKLRNVILENYGVFDKFTGDGILAFFPEFFSGPSAGVLAVASAQRCHEVFQNHYREHRGCFMSVMQDTGLGIGIDFGSVSVVHMKGELTVVGTPVVYACRLGGAKAGQTLVNQPAYENLLAEFSEHIDFTETSIDFKHEGAMLAYSVSRNEKTFDIEQPPWLEAGSDS